MIMDNIRFKADKLPKGYQPEKDIIGLVLTKEITNYKSKSKYEIGEISGGLRISYNPKGSMTVTGSIGKFFYGENGRLGCSYSDLIEAFQQLSNILNLDICKARVMHFETGFNLKMNYPIGDYLKTLEKLPQTKKMTIEKWDIETVSFFNEHIKFSLYDKTIELREKEGIYKTDYILRIELKLKNKLERILKKETTYGADLLNPKKQQALLSHIQKIFKHIPCKPIKHPNITRDLFENEGDFALVKSLLDDSAMSEYLTHLNRQVKSGKIHPSTRYRKRIKAEKLLEIARKANLTETPYDELLEKITTYQLEDLPSEMPSDECNTPTQVKI